LFSDFGEQLNTKLLINRIKKNRIVLFIYCFIYIEWIYI